MKIIYKPLQKMDAIFMDFFLILQGGIMEQIHYKMLKQNNYIQKWLEFG